MQSVKKTTITAENTWIDPLNVGGTLSIYMRIVSSGTATFTVQSSDDDGVNWVDEDQFTVEGSYDLNGMGLSWRVGCATGDYTDGTYELSIWESR